MTTENTPEPTTAEAAETPETTLTEQPQGTVSEPEPDAMPETTDTQPDSEQHDDTDNPNREAAKYRVRLRETEQERDDLKHTVHALQLGALGTVLGKGEYKAAIGADEALLEELENYECWHEDKLDYKELTDALTSIRERKPYLFDYNQERNAKHAREDAIRKYPVIKKDVFEHGICPYEDEDKISEWCTKFDWYIHYQLPTRDQIVETRHRQLAESLNGYSRYVKTRPDANPVGAAIRESRSKS